MSIACQSTALFLTFLFSQFRTFAREKSYDCIFGHRLNLQPQLSQVSGRNSKFRLRYDLKNYVFYASFKLHAYGQRTIKLSCSEITELFIECEENFALFARRASINILKIRKLITEIRNQSILLHLLKFSIFLYIYSVEEPMTDGINAFS